MHRSYDLRSLKTALSDSRWGRKRPQTPGSFGALTAIVAISALAAAIAVACTPDKLAGREPPEDEDDFNPGTLPPVGSTTTGYGGQAGASGSAGTAGSAGLPCDNDDTLKRCAHKFTYPDMGEGSVEVRGDWNGPSTWLAGALMTKENGVWSATVDVPWTGEIQYKFVLNGNNWIIDPNNPDTFNDGNGNTNSLLKGEMCEDYTCAAPPILGYDWRDAVLYFVFVDRFLDGNPANNGAPSGAEPSAEYKGGDYAGLLDKINEGYFTDLGVNTLWLTVPMQNPNNKEIGSDGKYYSAYHGYWPSDLDKGEEHFGTDAELKAVVDAAHANGMKVIVDYAMNHVHKSAPVYAQHNDWFWPNSNGGGNCVCGEGCSWDDAVQAKRCWFRDYLPDFNFTIPEARKFSVDNAIAWIEKTGIDGYRLDAVKHIETSWITDLRSRVKSDIEPKSMQHFYMVGETFTGNKGLIKSYVDPFTMLDGQFDFPLRVALARTVLMRKAPMSELAGFLDSNDGYYGAGVMSTFIGNHDMPRPIHFAQDVPLWGDEWADGKDKNFSNQPPLPGGTSAFERLANAFTVLFTTQGVPLIYYGDEIGLPGAGDPDNRRMMQWSAPSQGQKVLLDRLKKLTKIRADHPALRHGSRTTIGSTADTLAYKMTGDGETVYVVINRADSQQSVSGLPGGALKDLMTDMTVNGPTVAVPARSSMILQ
jgi:glycosidase